MNATSLKDWLPNYFLDNWFQLWLKAKLFTKLRKNGGKYFFRRQNFFDGFRNQNVRKLEDFLSKKCPEFGKLSLFKEFRLLQTVVSIENKWFMVQEGVKCPKKLKKEGWKFFWKCEICMEKVYRFQSKYFILISIFMENHSKSKAKMIIILWRPFVRGWLCNKKGNSLKNSYLNEYCL